MPKLNHTGPEGKGSKTGRKLGKCRKSEDELTGEFGKGQGKHYHSPDAKGEGKRLRNNQSKQI